MRLSFAGLIYQIHPNPTCGKGGEQQGEDEGQVLPTIYSALGRGGPSLAGAKSPHELREKRR